MTKEIKRFNLFSIGRYTLVFIILFFLVGLAVVMNINTGSVNISTSQIFDIIVHNIWDGSVESNIIWKIRMPRLVMAAVLGGALAVSGYMLQTFFRNPIAGPFVLGISSGAKMCVGFVMIFAARIGYTVGSYTLILAAFVGSLIVMGFVLLCAKRAKNMSMLLVIGIMIGYICSAITDFFVTFADETDIANLTLWSMGSFSSSSWSNVGVVTAVVAVAIFLSFLIAKPMEAYSLGEGYASSMGINIKLFRVILILLSSLLSACVTAFAGPISFVGIAVPHIAKIMMKTAKPIIILPASFLTGAVFCLFCDLIARTAFAPTELAIGTVTAMFGAPIVIKLMLEKRTRG